MPKEITHWFVAERVYRHLDQGARIKQILARGMNLYRIGAILPDVPFYVVAGPGRSVMPHRGEVFHDPAGSSYRDLVRYLNRRAAALTAADAALLLGVLTHIHTDAAFHPLVFHLSGPFDTDVRSRRRSKLRHHLLETRIDEIMMRRHVECAPHRIYDLIKAAEAPGGCVRQCFAALFDMRPAAARNAVFQSALIQRQFFNQTLRRLVYRLNRAGVFDMRVVASYFYRFAAAPSKPEWSAPIAYRDPVTGQRLRRSLEQLTADACRMTHAVFAHLEDCTSIRPWGAALARLKGPNLYTGRFGLRRLRMRFFSSAPRGIAGAADRD
jgi:hypothetical protein